MQYRHNLTARSAGKTGEERSKLPPFSGPQLFQGMRKHWAAWQLFAHDCEPENLSQAAAWL